MLSSWATDALAENDVEKKKSSFSSSSAKGVGVWSDLMSQEPLMAFIYQGVVESVKSDLTKTHDFMVSRTD